MRSHLSMSSLTSLGANSTESGATVITAPACKACRSKKCLMFHLFSSSNGCIRHFPWCCRTNLGFPPVSSSRSWAISSSVVSRGIPSTASPPLSCRYSSSSASFLLHRFGGKVSIKRRATSDSDTSPSWAAMVVILRLHSNPVLPASPWSAAAHS